MGAGNFSLHIGAFDLGGIGTATLAAIVLNLILSRGEEVKVREISVHQNTETSSSITPIKRTLKS